MTASNIPRVRKPLIIRAIGWLALFLVLWVPAMWVAEWLTGYHFLYFPFFAWLAFVFSLPFLVVWMLATILYRIHEQRAKITAGEIMRLQREVQEQTRGQGR